MAYTLTLTGHHRDAVDWVGGRYAHGDKLRRLLWLECAATPEDADWDEPGDITFRVPEHIAWEIAGIVEEDGLACFADELREVLTAFCAAIV